MNVYTDAPATEKVKRAIRDACYRREGRMLELYERLSFMIGQGHDPESVIFNYGSDNNEYDWQAEFTAIIEKISKG